MSSATPPLALFVEEEELHRGFEHVMIGACICSPVSHDASRCVILEKLCILPETLRISNRTMEQVRTG
jgi:hypothetical protein